MRVFINHFDVFDFNNNGTRTFAHKIIIWEEDGCYYRATIPHRGTYNLQSIPRPVPIPIDDLRPSYHRDFTLAPIPIPADAFVKQASPAKWIEGASPTRGEVLVKEAHVYELLRTNPHENICHYYGVFVIDDRVAGLCLRKYARTLSTAVEEDREGILDWKKIIEAINAGVTHLHSLKLIHNDLNPGNIMLDSDNNPFIIDFDSCVFEGEKAGGGTPGWARCWEKDRIAKKGDDEEAVACIGQFLKGAYNPLDHMSPV